MKIWKIALYVVAFAVFASCGSFKPAPSNTIKVLAVTAEGDTIQLDVNSLRPRVYQNIYHTYPYYYSYWHPSPGYQYGWGYNNYTRPVVRPYRPNNSNSNSNSNSNQSGSGPNTSSPALVKPSISINKPATNNNQTKGNGSTGNRRIN